MKNRIDTKKIIVLGMFTAISFVVTVLSKTIPPLFSATPFLTLDFKDAFVAIVSFIYGPLAGLLVTVTESFIEMFTISTTGIIGFVMNVLSTGAFAVTASLIYSKKKTIGGAVMGLIIGSIAMTGTMILWNWLVTPIYMGVPRGVVAGLLIPGILPFNVLKAVLNSALSLLLYKRIIYILNKAGLLPKHAQTKNSRISIMTFIVSAVIIIVCVLIMLALLKII